MEDLQIDWIAVIIAAILYMVIGTVWYSKYLFGPLWEQLSGIKAADIKKRKMPIFGSALIAFLTAYFLAYFYAYLGVTTVSDGMFVGFCFWLGFVATTQLGSVIWGKSTFRLFLIVTGAKLLSFLVMGGLIGA
ncbi:MAG: DUF1761 domain-containing protein [Chlamydiales bacterium]|nr:DUF1761 domain-containing protein [Chlamydiales bacterium]